MNKADLYLEGARLPEHLSRLLFLEGMIAGRRVLEVGARSPAIARFLLELGASRVVCVVDDRDLLEQLRAENDLERVDYRAIRPAGGSRPPGVAAVPVLPGDDGAFDLVIDFALAEALAAGHSERLTDIKRLLADEGFALCALTSSSRGLAGLLSPPQTEVPRLGYRPLVEALQGTFELVQVYFQSLLLGFLFGTFDHKADGNGIAPQTHLMGDDPEPAGAYLFAFGNAIPVIEDVCLVQIPFDALLDAARPRRETPSGPVDAVPPPRPLPETATDSTSAADFGDTTEHGVGPGDPGPAADDVVTERNARIAELELALSQALRPDENATLIPGTASDEALERITRELDDAVARSVAFEERTRLREAELMRAVLARDELRHERDALAEQLVGIDGARGDLFRQARELEGELVLTRLRVDELEELCIGLDAQRSAVLSELVEARTTWEGERLRANAEREMLEAAVAENDALIVDIEQALTASGLDLHTLRRAGEVSDEASFGRTTTTTTTTTPLREAVEEPSTVASRLRVTLEQRFAAAEARAATAEALVDTLESALARAEADRDGARQALDDALVEAEALFTRQLAAHTTELRAGFDAEASARGDAVANELATVRADLERRTAEAARLAAAVQDLIAERASHRERSETVVRPLVQHLVQQRDAALVRAIAAESRASGHAAELTTLSVSRGEEQQALAAEVEALRATAALLEEQQRRAEDRRRADHRLLDEVRQKLEVALRESGDLLGQRSVLQGALASRERELAALQEDLGDLRTALEQQSARSEALTRHEAALKEAAESLSLEVRRLHGLVEESGQRALGLQQEREALARAIAVLEVEKAAALDETRRFVELVEETEASVSRERAHWHATHDAEVRQLHEAMAAASVRADGAERALAQTLEAARLAGDEAARREQALETEHARTRDELAELTHALLALEAQVAEERTVIAARANAAGQAIHGARTRIAEQEVVQAALVTERDALVVKLAALGAALDDAEAHADRVTAVADAERSRREAGEAAFAQLTQTSSTWRDERDDARRAHADAVARGDDLEQARGELLRRQVALTDELATLAADADATIAGLRADLAASTGGLDTARVSLDAASAALAELRMAFESRGDELDALRRALAERDAALNDAEARFSAFVADTDVALDALRRERDALGADRAVVGRERDRLAGALADATANATANALALEATLQGVRDALTEQTAAGGALEARLLNLNGDLVTLRRELDDARSAGEASNSREAAVRARLESTEAEALTLLAKLEEVTGARDAAHAAIEASRAELRQSEATLTSLQETHDRLGHELERVAGDHRATVAALEGVTTERDRARDDVVKVGAERDGLQAQLTAIEAALATAQSAQEEAHEEVTRLGASLADAEAARDAALAEIARVNASRDAVVADLAQVSAERDDARARLDDAAAASAGLKAERDALQRQLDALGADASDGARRVEALGAEAALLRATLGEARSLLEVERARGDLFAEELKELADAAGRAHARGELFSAHLDEARADAASLRATLLRQAGHHTETTDELTQTVAQLSADADGERARGELLAALLEEARASGGRLQARADELAAVVDELQQRAAAERSRGDIFAALLDEAQATLARERARGDAFGAHLEEVQAAAGAAHARGDVLGVVIDEARLAFAALAAREAEARAALEVTRRELGERTAASDEADAARAALAAELAMAARLRGELGDSRALVESLGSELLGLRDAVASTREDAAEAIAAAEERAGSFEAEAGVAAELGGALQALRAEHDEALAHLADARAALADEARVAAARDAAEEALERAEATATMAAERARALEAEVATLRESHAEAIADAQAAVSASAGAAALRDRLESAERQLRLKDEKIAEQSERIDRLTERIVRTEGLR